MSFESLFSSFYVSVHSWVIHKAISKHHLFDETLGGTPIRRMLLFSDDPWFETHSNNFNSLMWNIIDTIWNGFRIYKTDLCYLEKINEQWLCWIASKNNFRKKFTTVQIPAKRGPASRLVDEANSKPLKPNLNSKQSKKVMIQGQSSQPQSEFRI